MRSVRLSHKIAKALVAMAKTSPSRIYFEREVAEAERALKPRPVSTQRRAKAAKRETKRAQTEAIRREAFNRSGGNCECGCGRFVDWLSGEMDHYPGRIRKRQSPEWCWFLHRDCHRAKGLGRPTSGHWHQRFLNHAVKHELPGAAKYARDRIEAELLIQEASQ